MITEQQKYTSSLLKNIGFALLTPCGSVAFQWIVFRKSLFLGHSLYAMIAFILAWILIGWGYLELEENNNEV